MDFVIANRIKELRKSRNITQEKLAEKCDISRSKVSSWETNKRDMSITDAINLARCFEISLDGLLRVDCISENDYIEISQRFFKDAKISLDEKINIIRILEKGIIEDNISEIYEKYKMTQNETE